MKSRKSQSPSNIIAEMLKALPDQCIQLIADLINAIIKEGKFLKNGTAVILGFV